MLTSTRQLNQPLTFYSFLASHSLLIGFLPFYLPVFLWGHGFDLPAVSLLMGATGTGFVVSLKVWQRHVRQVTLRRLFARILAIEIILVLLLLTWPQALGLLPSSMAEQASTLILIGALVIGFMSGTYNAWFWTTQRTLFLAMTANSNTGRQYGNFQIIVTVFLKVGILVGGLLLDAGQSRWGLLLTTALVAGGMVLWYRKVLSDSYLPVTSDKTVTLVSSWRFRDKFRSFPIFVLDGIFLFFESHFWLLSLFLVVEQDFSSLGLVVVALAVFFGVTFWLLKNTIDSFTGNATYWVATLLYAASWLLRADIDADMTRNALLVFLLLITFFSSFFRLAFNKRFFDLARQHDGTHYLLVKSYLSQCIIAVFFIALSVALTQADTEALRSLPAVYGFAALASLGYLLYRKPVQ